MKGREERNDECVDDKEERERSSEEADEDFPEGEAGTGWRLTGTSQRRNACNENQTVTLEKEGRHEYMYL